MDISAVNKRKKSAKSSKITPIKRYKDEDSQSSTTQRKSSMVKNHLNESVDFFPSISPLKFSATKSTHARLDNVDVDSSKLPRFGEKLTSKPSDLDAVEVRLKKIYEDKLKAFKWPRFREVAFAEGSDKATKKRAESYTGILNSSDMTVEMMRFRGTFSPYFGKHFMTEDGVPKTTLSPFEAYFLVDMGTLEVTTSENCVLSVEDIRALMEDHVPNFSRRYAVFSELHRATQFFALHYGTPRISGKKVKKESKNEIRNSPSSSAPGPSRPSEKITFFLSKDSTIRPFGPVFNFPEPPPPLERNWTTEEEARKILGLNTKSPSPFPVTASKSTELDEIPPFSSTVPVNVPSSPSNSLPESFDVAFTCYSRLASIGARTPQFDVAVTDFHRRDIPISDLFLTLESRLDPSLPLYVAKDDMGQLNGFAAVLADIPTVVYQGLSDV